MISTMVTVACCVLVLLCFYHILLFIIISCLNEWITKNYHSVKISWTNKMSCPLNNLNSLYAQQFAQQQAFFNNLQQAASAGNTGNSYSYAPSYSAAGPSYSSGSPSYSAASATGSVGPSGVYQTASIYPSSAVSMPKPKLSICDSQSVIVNLFTIFLQYSPNVVTSRFGSGGPGFNGVSTFASSDSSGNRQAYTSVNDNGRVTTYHTRS